jgi:hypothetical protein
LIGSGCLSVLTLHATAVPVDFTFAETAPNTTQVSLPMLLNGPNDTVFLKFKIPEIGLIEAINSFTINVTVYDNGDGGGETGTIQFALPSENLDLGGFAPNLNRTTSSSPVTLSFSLTPDEIALVLPTIQDGNFRIKVLRDTGDFFVGGGSASIDAMLAPEPASLFTAISGLLMAVAWRRRRRA